MAEYFQKNKAIANNCSDDLTEKFSRLNINDENKVFDSITIINTQNCAKNGLSWKQAQNAKMQNRVQSCEEKADFGNYVKNHEKSKITKNANILVSKFDSCPKNILRLQEPKLDTKIESKCVTPRSKVLENKKNGQPKNQVNFGMQKIELDDQSKNGQPKNQVDFGMQKFELDDQNKNGQPKNWTDMNLSGMSPFYIHATLKQKKEQETSKGNSREINLEKKTTNLRPHRLKELILEDKHKEEIWPKKYIHKRTKNY